MGDKIACLIWCEGCYRHNFAEVHTWVWSGQAVVRSGRLKVAMRCGACDAQLVPGDRVDTVTLHTGLMEAAGWAAEFVVFGKKQEDEWDYDAEEGT